MYRRGHWLLAGVSPLTSSVSSSTYIHLTAFFLRMLKASITKDSGDLTPTVSTWNSKASRILPRSILSPNFSDLRHSRHIVHLLWSPTIAL